MSNIPAQIEKDYIAYNCNEAWLYIWESREYVNVPEKVKVVEIGIHNVPRDVFDRLPGKEQEIKEYSGGARFWHKNIQESLGVELNFFTHEPPLGE